jgi:hypothetical protein
VGEKHAETPAHLSVIAFPRPARAAGPNAPREVINSQCAYRRCAHVDVALPLGGG